MKKTLFALLLCLLCSVSVFGQLKKARLGSASKEHIGFSFGINYPSFQLDQPNVGPHLNFEYTYYIKPYLGLRGQLNYDWFTSGRINDNFFNSHNIDLTAQVVYNYYIFQGGRKENNAFTAAPERCYVFGGVGALCNLRADQAYNPNFAAVFPLGTGLQWAAGDAWTFGLDFAWNFTTTKQLGFRPEDSKMTDGFLSATFSLTYKIPDFDMPVMDSYQINRGNPNKIEYKTSNRINQGNKNKIEYKTSNRINRGNKNKIEYHTANRINRGNKNKIEYHTAAKINRGGGQRPERRSSYQTNRRQNKIAGVKTYKVNRGGRSRVDNRRSYSNRTYRHRPMQAKKLYKKGVRHMKCDPRKGCTFTFD
ncbi:MAG: hypothetical protein J5808_05540 [Paludibacteraceae bacterium]|nr:hypothetical protein [Paludibacteraceae bacterium]